MKKLRIAHYFPYDSSHTGGVQEHVYYLTRTLMELGHSVHIWGTPKPILKYNNYHSCGSTYQIPAPTGNFTNLHLVDKNEISKLVKTINANFDILHVHDPNVPFLSWELLKHVKIPLVATFHMAWNQNSPLNLINLILPLLKDAFSRYVRSNVYVSYITRHCWQGLCRKNIRQTVIYNGIDHLLYYPKPRLNPDFTRLLFVGNLIKRKGLIYLLQAYESICREFPATSLTVVGDGQERQALERYVKNHKMSSGVIFAGEIIGKKKIGYYQASDIFCVPYSDEAFGITVLEAMACGVPLVGFKNDAFGEWLKDYPTPELLVRPNDVVKLRQALVKLITDTNLRKLLSSWCESESRKYSWEKTTRETVKVYEQVLI